LDATIDERIRKGQKGEGVSFGSAKALKRKIERRRKKERERGGKGVGQR
jgi:hypothetical protein